MPTEWFKSCQAFDVTNWEDLFLLRWCRRPQSRRPVSEAVLRGNPRRELFYRKRKPPSPLAMLLKRRDDHRGRDGSDIRFWYW